MRRQFPLVRADDEYTSDNLEHDFPVRIIYVLDGDGRLSGTRLDPEPRRLPGLNRVRTEAASVQKK